MKPIEKVLALLAEVEYASAGEVFNVACDVLPPWEDDDFWQEVHTLVDIEGGWRMSLNARGRERVAQRGQGTA